jgi:hypothetical protein
MVGWRLILALAALSTVFLFLRQQGGMARTLMMLPILVTIAHAASVGSAGQGRFMVPIAPFVCVLAAIGLRRFARRGTMRTGVL